MNFEQNDFLENNDVYYKLGSNYIFTDKYTFKNIVTSLICFTLVPEKELNFNDWFDSIFISDNEIVRIDIDGNDINYEYNNSIWNNNSNISMPIKINMSYQIIIESTNKEKQSIDLDWKGMLIDTIVLDVKTTTELYSSCFVTGETKAFDFLKNIDFYFEGDTLSTVNNISDEEKKKYIKDITTVTSDGNKISTTNNKGQPTEWTIDITLNKNIGLKLNVNKNGNMKDMLKYIVIKVDNNTRISEFITKTIGDLTNWSQILYY